MCLLCICTSFSDFLDSKDKAEMREFLHKKGQRVPETASYAKLLSLYEMAGDGLFDYFNGYIKAIKYPIKPTSALHCSQPDFECIKEVQVVEMEKLLLAKDIPIKFVLDLVHICHH